MMSRLSPPLSNAVGTMRIAMHMAGALALIGLAGPASADSKRNQLSAFFSRVQESGPLTQAELDAHRADGIDEAESIAADVALNDWKKCVLDALPRWADLGQGPGTIVDGAFGRCADLALLYRIHLQRLTQDGRQVMDLQMARTMTRGLEDAWRPRLIAAALDQMLASRHPMPPTPAPAG